MPRPPATRMCSCEKMGTVYIFQGRTSGGVQGGAEKLYTVPIFPPRAPAPAREKYILSPILRR
jgi:hypothetical protein